MRYLRWQRHQWASAFGFIAYLLWVATACVLVLAVFGLAGFLFVGVLDLLGNDPIRGDYWLGSYWLTLLIVAAAPVALGLVSLVPGFLYWLLEGRREGESPLFPVSEFWS